MYPFRKINYAELIIIGTLVRGLILDCNRNILPQVVGAGYPAICG